MDGSGSVTELEKFEPERVDLVTSPATGLSFLLLKGLPDAPEGDIMQEDDIAKNGDAADDDSPDTGAPGDDIDGAGDSHEDDDDDKASKETAPAVAELAEPSAEAVKAAAADYETARRDWLAAEPGLKGADSATELLKARADWNHWNTLGKDEGLDGSEEGRKRWIVKHLTDGAPEVTLTVPAAGELVIPDAVLACSDQVLPATEAELAKELLDAEEAIYKRTFTADERRKAAAENHALPDGSYPIENTSDLDNAATLARSGHGQVAEAKALIRRRAKELGVNNPLDDGGGSATKADSDSDADDMPPGKKPCPTCKGKKTIKDGNMKCPACKGKGFMKPKAAAKEAVRVMTETALKAGMITQQAADEILAQITDDEVAEKASRPLPSTTEPVAPHREPDGTSTIEQLEPDAGLGTDPDKTADKVPASVAALTMKEAPYVVKRAHDAFCAAYAGSDVLEEYPAMKSVADAAETLGGWFSGLAAKAAETGDATEAADLAALVKAAEAVRSFDPAAVDDGRALLHKSFQQMYPTEHISPKDAPKPGSYTRPYLSSSHAAESAGDWTVNIPESTRTPSADDYQRGNLTAGHQSPSPGDHGPNNPQGHDVRQYYTTSQKDMAMAAMRSMHDHIAATFSGCCPMAPSTMQMPPGMGAAHAPGTMAPPSQGGINTVKEASVFDEAALRAAADAVARKAVKKAARKAALDATAPAMDPAVIQNMVAEQLDALTGPLNDQIATLRKELDELGKQPDPAMAPVRGQMARRPAGDQPAPVEKRSLIEEARERQAAKAADERANFVAYLQMQAGSDDPKVRERAEELLTKQELRTPA